MPTAVAACPVSCAQPEFWHLQEAIRSSKKKAGPEGPANLIREAKRLGKRRLAELSADPALHQACTKFMTANLTSSMTAQNLDHAATHNP
jgi:hypothetical protein